MAQLILTGRRAKDYIGLAKDRLHALKMTGLKYASSVIDVRGGTVIAQRIGGVLERILIDVKDTTFATFVYLKTGTFQVQDGRVDGVMPLALTPSESVVTQPYGVYAGPGMIGVKEKAIYVLRDAGVNAVLDPYTNVSSLFSITGILRLDPRKNIVEELFVYNAAQNYGGEVFIAFEPCGEFQPGKNYIAALVQAQVGVTSTSAIILIPVEGTRAEAVTAWPYPGFELYTVAGITAIGRGVLLFFANYKIPGGGGGTLQPPLMVRLDVFNGTVDTSLVGALDDRFSAAAGIPGVGGYPFYSTGVYTDACYAGNGVVFLHLHNQSAETSGGTNKQSIVWKSTDHGSSWSYCAVTDMFEAKEYISPGLPLFGEHNIVSVKPGHVQLLTNKFWYWSEDYGNTWLRKPYDWGSALLVAKTRIPSFIVPMQYGTDGVPTQFVNTYKTDTEAIITVCSDPTAVQELYHYAINPDSTDYSYINSGLPAVRYFGDEHDTPPLLPGHKGALEIPT